MNVMYGKNCMLIHCIGVVHIELHLCDNTPKIRHKFTKNARFVEPPQRFLWLLAGCHDAHKDFVRLRVLPEFMADQIEGLADEAKGLGMNIEIMFLGLGKNT